MSVMVPGSLVQLLLTATCLEYFQLATAASFLTHILNSSRYRRGTCGLTDFTCQSGQCVSKFLVCDGHIDCRDKTDETADLCGGLGIQCPVYSFQCAYGACIEGTRRCDGVPDCSDKSDENCGISFPKPDPPPPVIAPSKVACLNSEYQCTSGQCIDKYLHCDGKKDCKDGSDETAATCKDFPCESFYFRCSYGACVKGDAMCNRINDCHDGSDETFELCHVPAEEGGGTHQPAKPHPVTSQPVAPKPATPHPDPNPVTSQSVVPPTVTLEPAGPHFGAVPEVPPDPKDGCEVPLPPSFSHFSFGNCSHSDTSPNCFAQVGDILPVGAELGVQCIEDYHLDGDLYIMSCTRNKKWNPSTLSHCRRRCEPLINPNLAIECSFTEVGSTGVLATRYINCNEHMFEGTKAIVKCPAYFKERPDNILFCTSIGHWDGELVDCEPQCGYRDTDLSPTIWNGKNASISDYPWHVGIYWTKLAGGIPNYEYQCGGSLISPTIILTAAHCGYSRQQKKWVPAGDIVVGLGKQKSIWEEADVDKVQRFRVSRFVPREEYDGEDSWSSFDVALIILSRPIKMTISVYPVCVNTAPYRFKDGGIGTVPGWGHNELTATSPSLLVADIPFMNRNDCNSLLRDDEKELTRTDDKFCGGYAERGPKTYTGDSGGGLVYKDGKINYIVGIVSTTLNRPDFWVSFYSNVSFHSDWILSRMKSRHAA